MSNAGFPTQDTDELQMNGSGDAVGTEETESANGSMAADSDSGSDSGSNMRSAEALSFDKAFRTALIMIRLMLLVLGMIFFASNIFWVPEGTIAVQTRFGKLSGSGSGTIRHPGGPYLALPYPLHSIERLETTIQSVGINNAFFLKEGSTVKYNDGFIPGVHGSLITADKNLVQGTWTVHYRIDFSPHSIETADPVELFLEKVGNHDNARNLVKTFAEQALVTVVAGTTVEDFVNGKIDHNAIQGSIQKKLDRIGAGLIITGVAATSYFPPHLLTRDFQMVTQAESEKAQQIEQAMRYRISQLSEAAGEKWEVFLEELNKIELASGSVPDQHNGSADFLQEPILLEMLGGHAAQTVDRARTEKTQIIEKAGSDVARFQSLLPSYRNAPSVLKTQLFQDAFRDIASDPTTRIHHLPSGARLFLPTNDK